MRILLAIVLVLAMIPMAGCMKQKTDDIATLPPLSEFDAGPVYGTGETGTTIDVGPQPIVDTTSPDMSTTSVEPIEPVAPPPPPPPPPAPKVHIVARGDTVWNIAVRHYGDGQRWRDIVAANGNIDPKKLAVGQRLILP